MDREKLEELSKIHSSYAIAKELGRSQTNIRYWLAKYNLKTLQTRNSKGRKLLKFKCLGCGKENNKTHIGFGKYCDNKCRFSHEREDYLRKWKEGIISGNTVANEVSKYVRKYILEKYDFKCCECSWGEMHPDDGRPLVHIDHIDGDSSNCKESNLRVLCPNCHSKTSTFGSRNKNSARPKKVNASK